MANHFSVVHKDAYISGTMYPDSRWITGRKREETHCADCLQPEFADTDFTRGWHIHCLCDHIQSQVCRQLFPHWEQLSAAKRWLEKSVISMIQDQADMPALDLDISLSWMNHPQGPLGEDPLLVQQYYDIIRKVYAGKTRLSLNAYYELWLMVGLAQKKARTVMDHMETRIKSQALVDTVTGVYPQMVRQATAS